jgi:hypothetical protein
MVFESNTAALKGVICLFCGAHTPVPPPADTETGREFDYSTSRYCIVRCYLCGKEAPYLANELLDIEEIDLPSNYRARAVGL